MKKYRRGKEWIEIKVCEIYKTKQLLPLHIQYHLNQLTYKKAIGHHTNNVAEYLGLIVGLRHCIDQKINNVAVYGDSKLVVEQTMGNWKVKSENLIHLQNEVKKCLQCINNISITHIYRKHNKVADRLANEALDW